MVDETQCLDGPAERARLTVRPVAGPSAGLTLLFAVSVGITVLALFASQPLVGPIGRTFGLGGGLSGLVTTLTLLGYSGGLFLLVPLTDMAENRRLIVRTLWADVIALAAAALAPSAGPFLAASFAIGVTTSAIQMLVPVAAALAPPEARGRVVGNVMSGLMLGILLSRPAASLVTGLAGSWRVFYAGTAILIALLAVALARLLPQHRSEARTGYGALIGSLVRLLADEPALRRRAAYQALCMGAFGAFWTSVALRLAAPPFSLGQGGIGLFALTGAAGAVIAPIAGRLGDRGRTRAATFAAHGAVIAAMLVACWAGTAHGAAPVVRLGALAASAVLLDLGVIGDQTLGRRIVNLLRPEARGRVNGLYTGIFFLGSAAGAALSGVAWSHGGWTAVCGTGLGFAGVALVLFLTETP